MMTDELQALAESVKVAREKLYVLQCCDVYETEEERNARQALKKAEEALAKATDEITILALLDKLIAAERDNESLNATFDMQHRAEMRAVRRWRKQSPTERALTLPDHANLCVWLFEQLEAAEAEVVRAEDNVASLGFRIGQLKCENARLARHYEELRQSTDGGSTSMTHADACHVVEALEQQLAEVNAENTRLRAATIDASHLERQRQFSLKVFGPGARSKGVVAHIRKELLEIEADPSDLKEWVDVIILAFDGAWRAGHTPSAIIDAVKAKQSLNESRTWPDWRTSSPDKAIEHIRDTALTPEPTDRISVYRITSDTGTEETKRDVLIEPDATYGQVLGGRGAAD